MNNRQGSRQRPPPMAAAVATAVHRDSHAISKAMISKPKIKIWHVLPPEIIHTDAANFRDLVQRLTGFQHTSTTTKSKPPTTATASPPPPTSSSQDDQEGNNNNNTPMTMAIKDELKEEEEEEEEEEEQQQQQQQVERMFWMEESSLGFLRALEEDQNDHDHDQFFLHGFADLHLLPFING